MVYAGYRVLSSAKLLTPNLTPILTPIFLVAIECECTSRCSVNFLDNEWYWHSTQNIGSRWATTFRRLTLGQAEQRWRWRAAGSTREHINCFYLDEKWVVAIRSLGHDVFRFRARP